jgi:choline dehydrogenase
LSANPDVKVLVIERGTISNSFFAKNVALSFPGVGPVPAKRMELAPQKHLNGKVMRMYESIYLGGRSSINGSLYMQGCPDEYNSWGEGWQWEDVAPFFARFERRLELEPNQLFDPNRQGGEWKTRVIGPQFESTRQYPPQNHRL